MINNNKSECMVTMSYAVDRVFTENAWEFYYECCENLFLVSRVENRDLIIA